MTEGGSGNGNVREDGRAATSPVASGPSPLAFFDLDGTLVAGQTQQMLVAFLRQQGMVSRRFLAGTVLWFAGYKLGLVEATDEARARGAALLEGLEVDRVRSLMDRFRDERLAPRLFPPAVNALARHRTRGDRVVILSAAFEPLVATLARRLQVTDWVATTLETEDGRYTGRVSGRPLYGGEKASAALAVMGEEGADPDVCWAYADHDTDLELLRAVGHPVAVRPKGGLRAAAVAAGWPVVE